MAVHGHCNFNDSMEMDCTQCESDPHDLTLGVAPLDNSSEDEEEMTAPPKEIGSGVQTVEKTAKPRRGVTPADQVSGRRLMDPAFIFAAIKQTGYHAPFNCTFVDMDFITETKVAGRSCFKFKCRMCNKIEKIWSEDPKEKTKMDVTSATVLGIISIGAGYTQLQELFGALDMPCFSSATYQHYQSIVAAGITEAMLRDMYEAAQEEAQLARDAGDISPDDIPYITVVVDGSWLKRSYKNNFCSLLGSVSAAFLSYQ